MKTTADVRRLGRLFFCLLIALLPVLTADAAGPATTTVADIVYRADGSAAAGTLVIAWPAFTTADGKAVPAGRKTVKIGAAGAVSIPLVPNFGASPEGTYYKVTYKLDDGSTSEEFWSVPAAPTTTISAIRSKLVPANVAVQYATRQYVDSLFAQGGGGGSGNATQIQGTDVEATPPVSGQSLVFDGSRYKPQGHTEVDVVRDCGLSDDGVSDQSAAFAACWSSHLGRKLFFPAGAYYFASTITAPAGAQGTEIEGEGVGYGKHPTLKFAPNITGINLGTDGRCTGCKIHNFTLDGQLPAWSLTGASQCVLPSLAGTADEYPGLQPTGGSTADGIFNGNGYVVLENLLIESFGRFGIRMIGSGANADFVHFRNVLLFGNRGEGFNENGSDTQASSFEHVVAQGNILGGIRDRSFLGNTWINPVSEFNAAESPVPATAATASLSRSANLVTVTLASALPGDAAGNPGVGNAIKIAGVTGAGGTTFNGTFFIATISGDRKTITYAQTAANDSASVQGTARTGTCNEARAAAGWTPYGLSFPAGAANSTIIGGYDESPGTQFGLNTVVIGGNYGVVDWSDATARPAVFITGHGTPLSMPMTFSDRALTVAGTPARWQIKAGGGCRDHADNSLLCLVDTAQTPDPQGTVSFKMKTIGGQISHWYGFQIGLTENDYDDSFRIPNYLTNNPITGDSTHMQFQAGPWMPHGFFFGNNSIAGKSVAEFGIMNATPTWSSAKGSLVMNNTVTAGGFAGWASTGGTDWRAFGPVANDATGTSWSFPQITLGSGNALTGVSGNSGTVAQTSGTMTASRCVHTDANGNLTVAAADCGSGGGGATAWSSLTGAAGALTLANANHATTFQQTSAVDWTWANVAPAVHLTPQNSPLLKLAGTYYNGSASAADTWTAQGIVGTADNGPSTLAIAHTGSSGAAAVSVPRILVDPGAGASDAVLKVGPNAAAGFVGVGPLVAMAYNINDTTFPSVHYPMGMVDANDVSATNGGANNVIYGSFFSQMNAHGAGFAGAQSKVEAFVSQGELTGSTTLPSWQDFAATPTIGSGSRINRRDAYTCNAPLGTGTVGTDVCFFANNGAGYGFVQDGTGVNYLRGKLAVNYQGSPSEALEIGGAGGHLYFRGGKGQHIKTQAANSDLSGTVPVSASTTGSVTFTTAYAAAPVCVLTPYSAGLTSWYLDPPTTTGFTLHVAPSGSYTFGYICFGNPN